MGDHVFLKVMPKREVIRFSKRGKLSPRYIGPFEILERVGLIAYRLELPLRLSGVHEGGVSLLHAPEVYSRSNSCSGLRKDCCLYRWDLRGGISVYHG